MWSHNTLALCVYTADLLVKQAHSVLDIEAKRHYDKKPCVCPSLSHCQYPATSGFISAVHLMTAG